MSNPWKVRLDGVLREGEIVGLYFTTALLIVVEFCFVYWLHRMHIPEASSRAASGFIVMPPWYQKPRFEVTLLLTILAGLLFSVCWGLWNLWRKRTDTGSWPERGPKPSVADDRNALSYQSGDVTSVNAAVHTIQVTTSSMMLSGRLIAT